MTAVAACTLCWPISSSKSLWLTFTQFITCVVFQCLQCLARFVFHCASSESEKNNRRESSLVIPRRNSLNTLSWRRITKIHLNRFEKKVSDLIWEILVHFKMLLTLKPTNVISIWSLPAIYQWVTVAAVATYTYCWPIFLLKLTFVLSNLV